ncbi:unnamed protein product [Porites evermanni]|uniref:Apple domain-containing protein n=1 Tax=Porites evermanni TaxID=104178 RepID=A0ABN8LXV4_9CNID|nr:unnamed protein product [Porites evermanni]
MKEEYNYLNVSKVGTFTVYDSLDCTFECLGNPSCLSFNLAAYKGADGKFLCELLSSEKYSNPEEYKRNDSFHHFFVKVGTGVKATEDKTSELFSRISHFLPFFLPQKLYRRNKITLIKWHLTSKFFIIISDSMYVITVPERRYLCSELQVSLV